jgi:hypothetical protein
MENMKAFMQAQAEQKRAEIEEKKAGLAVLKAEVSKVNAEIKDMTAFADEADRVAAQYPDDEPVVDTPPADQPAEQQ